MKTARIVMWAILDYAKVKLMEGHYHMKAVFGDAYQIVYTDTDSMHYRIAGWPTEPERAMFAYDELRDAQGLEPVFDLSKYSEFEQRMIAKGRSGKLGIFKDEYGDNRVVEEIALGKKLYRVRNANGEETVKGKGMPNPQLRSQFSLEDFSNALYKGEKKQAEFNRMMRKNLVLEHTKVTKYAIATLNEAVFLLSPTGSRPHGHHRNCDEQAASAEWGERLAEVPAGLRQEHELTKDDLMILVGPCSVEDDPMEGCERAAESEDEHAAESEDELMRADDGSAENSDCDEF